MKGQAKASEIKTALAFQTFKKFAHAKFPNIEALVKGPECLKMEIHLIDAYGFADDKAEACNP